MKGAELVAKGCKYIEDRHTAVAAEYEHLQQKIKDSQNPDISGEAFAKELTKRIANNLDIIRVLYSDKTRLNNGEKFTQFTNRLNYNPIAYMLHCSQEILGDDEQITCKIADGTFKPDGLDSTDITTLGGGNFWGSSLPAIYGNILYLMARKKDDPIHLNKQSSFIHVAPLSKEQALQWDGTEYLYQADDKYGFAFPHTGYAQTGNRLDQHLYGDIIKEFAPKDCSQFVQEMLGHKEHFYTEDMLYTYRHLKGEGYIRKDWHGTAVANELCSNLEIVQPDDVQPGDIHLTRKFYGNKPTLERAGSDGHTTIVFSKEGKDVLTLGDGQYPLPSRDGFGLETYSIAPVQNNNENGVITETVFLRAKI